MTWLRFGTLSLLLGMTACAPMPDRAASGLAAGAPPVISGGWLAETAVSVSRSLASGEDRSFRKGSWTRESGNVSTRMILREKTDDGLRPLSVSFVGRDSFNPSADSEPRIVPAAAYLQCVPFARDLSGVALRGNAWTWWSQADGQYSRSHRPQAGAVMVMSRTEQLPLGHVAVVTEVLGDREIIVSHANWLNNGSIHLDTPVVDVSPNNDWSSVRAWYTPAKTLGLNVYPVSGFILPDPIQSARSGS